MTAILAAQCSDGSVIVADRMVSVTNSSGERIDFQEKLSFDIAHVITAYAGSGNAFYIFRERFKRDVATYTEANIILELEKQVRDIRAEQNNPMHHVEVVVALHHQKELYWINIDGKSEKTNYVARGTGKDIANDFCEKLARSQPTMKVFARQAYLAIKFMEQAHPELRVGTGEQEPSIRYLPFGKEWDCSPSDAESIEFKVYTEEKLHAYDARKNDLIRSL